MLLKWCCFVVSSQLYYDGHPNLAASLAKLTNTQPNCPPSDRLLHIVTLGLKTEQGTLHCSNAYCLPTRQVMLLLSYVCLSAGLLKKLWISSY